MRKLIVILMVLVMFTGCAAMQKFLCSTTPQQQSQAQKYLDAAKAELAILQLVVPTPEVQAVIAGLKLSIPILEQVVAGTCVAINDYNNAQNTVDGAKPAANAARAKVGLKLIP